MKIKTDFITNSSSTMFIFHIPTDFYPPEEDILEFMKEHDYEFKDGVSEGCFGGGEIPYEEYMLKELPDYFETLRDDGELWHYGFDGTPMPIFYTIVDILQKHNLELRIIDVTSEGNNRIVAITGDTIKKLFLAEGLKKIQVKGECEDVTED